MSRRDRLDREKTRALVAAGKLTPANATAIHGHRWYPPEARSIDLVEGDDLSLAVLRRYGAVI